ncbi:MAG: transcription antitermination factor NusB [Planctomycetota bacterium]|jgi:N utilization substance protein B
MIGGRTRSREIALQILYSVDKVTAPSLDHWEQTLEDTEGSEEVKAFAQALAAGVLAERAELDRLISGAADNWELSRLATVDRNVLRLAVHELISRDDIPAKVSINEAIELGKRFSTKQSGSFINGILDRIRRDMGLPTDEVEDEADEADESADDAADDAPIDGPLAAGAE